MKNVGEAPKAGEREVYPTREGRCLKYEDLPAQQDRGDLGCLGCPWLIRNGDRLECTRVIE